jgi:hypothetical protein
MHKGDKEMILERLLTIALLGLLLSLAFPSRAYAYLDPGSGSYIFQLIIAGVVGLGFLVKVYWGKITTFFTRGSSRKGTETEENPDA